MKELRTRAVAMTMITEQEMSPGCVLVSGVDAGLLDHDLWAPSEKDMMRCCEL